MNKKIIYAIVGIIVVVIAAWLIFKQDSQPNEELNTNQTNQTMNQTDTPTQTETQTPATDAITGDTVIMEVKDFGTIKIKLNTGAAPKTAANFLKLVNEQFYDGLTFHRIAQDFVIQGGDPKGDGTGGPGYTVPAEIGLKHTKGSIAMARLGDQVNPNKESSGSQFYIALNDLPMLDGQYTVFGQVIEGMDVVAKIGAVPITPGPFGGSDGPPQTPIVITSVTIAK